MRKPVVPILVAMAIIGVGLFWIVPPIPQPQWYHDFADKRPFLGIPNFWNVVSNLPFAFLGMWGISWVLSADSAEALNDHSARWMYVCLFGAVALTGVGSSYYHLEPNNQTLVWDRLPIAVTFMALFAIIISERIDRRLGVWSFWPLVAVGAATVVYWHLSETWGRGDLRPYFLAQFYPVVAIPVILWLCPPRYSKTGHLYSAIAWYVAAKIYEFLDKDLYSYGHIVSGHTLKHIGAAVSCYMILSWVRQRRLITEHPHGMKIAP